MADFFRHRLRQGNARWFMVLLFILAISSLSCFTGEVFVQVTPRDAETADIKMVVSTYLTERYIDLARQANAEMRQDYLSAGREPPEKPFAETWQEFDKEGTGTVIPGDNGRIVDQNDRGYTAEGTSILTNGQKSDADIGWTLTVRQEDPQWVDYIFELELAVLWEDFDVSGLDKYRREGLPPKPPLPPIEQGGGDSEGSFDLSGAFQDVEGEMDLHSWYLTRILLETGLPEATYRIDLPGQVYLHELDGQPAGQVMEGSNEVVLVLGEDLIREYGGGSHLFRIESRMHACELTCREHPNMTWDGQGDGESCSCICDQGWQSDEDGDCVACDQLCTAWDPRSTYDPTNSRPNACACSCSGSLLEWDDGENSCRCVSGAKPDGDQCRCPDGMEPDSWGTGCVETESSGKEPDAGDCAEGQTCLSNPEGCACGTGEVCDPLGEYNDPESFCSPKVAYIFISSDVSDYEKWWINPKINSIHQYYRTLGYKVRSITVDGLAKVSEHLGNPSTRAMAYFGHGIEPSLENAAATGVKNELYQILWQRLVAAGIDREQAREIANRRSNNMNLDYAYIHTCHSLDNNSLRDLLVRPGGTYWGKEGRLWAHQGLTESERP